MRLLSFVLLSLLSLTVSYNPAVAQDGDTLVIATVDRPPFAKLSTEEPTGFSIDLINAIAEDLNLRVTFAPQDSFGAMLDAVQTGAVDGAIANISITAARETMMDFSQPIFESGIQILMPRRGKYPVAHRWPADPRNLHRNFDCLRAAVWRWDVDVGL